MNPPIRIAVLLSGSGMTLQNLLDRIADGRLAAKVVRVVSSHVAALGLMRAETAGVPTTVVERKQCASREEFSRRIFDACRGDGAELVCMGGFLQLVEIPPDFMGRVMNIHPALIPAFCGKGFHGLHVHKSALEAGVKVSGCTVHFADNEYDHLAARRAGAGRRHAGGAGGAGVRAGVRGVPRGDPSVRGGALAHRRTTRAHLLTAVRGAVRQSTTPHEFFLTAKRRPLTTRPEQLPTISDELSQPHDSLE
jgi:phosphoribosylglycinamide formyltransferase 1